jgi:hypothetical protein
VSERRYRRSSGRIAAYTETGESGVAEIAASWSPIVYRFSSGGYLLAAAAELPARLWFKAAIL